MSAKSRRRGRWARSGYGSVLKVYRITCSANGRAYVGVSFDPALRFREHMGKSNRRSGKRRQFATNKQMTSDRAKHGAGAFSIEVLGSYDFLDALVAESIEIARLGARAYNVTPGGDYPMSPEARRDFLARLKQHAAEGTHPQTVEEKRAERETIQRLAGVLAERGT